MGRASHCPTLGDLDRHVDRIERFARGAACAMAKGAIYEIMGENYELTYKPDGTYMQGADPGGTWKADGKNLCHTPTQLGQESCSEVPDGKKSGDVFEATATLLGQVKVTIK